MLLYYIMICRHWHCICILYLTLQAYLETERKRWVLEWPGQVVLCVSQMFWTSEVHEILCSGPQVLCNA